MHIIGVVEYKDVFGNIHESGFDWQSQGGEFIISPNDKLNYYT